MMKIYTLAKYEHCIAHADDSHMDFMLMICDHVGTRVNLLSKAHILSFLLEGEMMLRFGLQEFVRIKAGTAVLIPEGVAYTVISLSRLVVVRLPFTSDKLPLCRLIVPPDMVPREKTLNYYTLPFVPVLRSFLEQIKTYIQDGKCCIHINDFKYRELFQLLIAYYPPKMIAYFLSPVLNENSSFREHIMKSYQLNDKVEELAEKLNMSTSTFTRKFKDCFSETPHQWIISRKAELIRSDLSKPTDTLITICDRYGFTTQAQFTSFCKKYLGNTPTEIRRMLLSAYSNK